ncbi:MAG: hypothetical protein WAV51_04105 [Microgenomates group bacterium]
MADEPISPQQLIDDAAKALGETPLAVDKETIKNDSSEQSMPPVEPLKEEAVLPEPLMQKTDIPTPPLVPSAVAPVAPLTSESTDTSVSSQEPTETIPTIPPPPLPIPEPITQTAADSVIIPSEEVKPNDTQGNKPPKQKKKKSEKGILIATLLFLVFTLPIAIYYITQSPQFAEIRSRAVYPTATPTPIGGGGTGSCTLGRVLYTTGSCASKGTVTSSFCPLDCGNLCCNRNDSVCCCMGCYPKGTDCSVAPYNCQGGGGGTGCPQTECYSGYPTTKVPHENCLVCNPDRSKLNTVTFSSDGTIRIHLDNVHASTTVALTKDGSSASMTKISDGNFEAVVTAGTYTIAVQLGNEDTTALGFILPDSNNKCGRYPGATRDISSSISSLSSYGITTTSGVDRPYQCWADAIQGKDTDQRGQLDANWDFEDFDAIIGYTATITNTPTPTETPTPTPTPTPYITDATPTVVYIYPTATPTIYKTPTPTTVRLIAGITSTPTPTGQPTPKIPVAGVGPGVVGAISVAGSILLLILGLIL